MRAYFILHHVHPGVPEISQAEIRELIEGVDICLMSELPPKVGDKFQGNDGNNWRVVSVDANGRTAEVQCTLAHGKAPATSFFVIEKPPASPKGGG